MTAPPTSPPASSPPSTPPATPPTTTSGQPTGGSSQPTSPFAGLTAEEKDRLLAEQARVIRENARKTAELETSLADLKRKVDAPPPPDPKVEAKRFYDDPVTATREVIRKELEETVKPLIEFKDEVKKDNAYSRLKAGTKADPRFKEFLGLPGVEALVDQMMEKLPATPEAMYSVIVGLKGSMAFGDIKTPGEPSGAPPAPRPADNITPPHLRPTPPPAPDVPPGSDKEAAYLKAEVEKLDENARRYIREIGMTPEDYVRWRDTEAIDVPTSKIGIKPPKDEGKK